MLVSFVLVFTQTQCKLSVIVYATISHDLPDVSTSNMDLEAHGEFNFYIAFTKLKKYGMVCM